MAERQKSKDGTRETEQVLGEASENLPKSPDQAGQSDGEIQRKVGTRDEEKRTDETSTGSTRPLGHDQDDSGDKEKV